MKSFVGDSDVTRGEGEPPEEAVALHRNSCSPKKRRNWKTPLLPCLASATPLMNFSASPEKISTAELAELGGEHLLDRVDADVEYR